MLANPPNRAHIHLIAKQKSKADAAGSANKASPSSGTDIASVEDKIPAMTDSGLLNLQANAQRAVESGSEHQKAEAERLLPIIAVAVEERAAARAEERRAKMAAQREAKRRAKDAASD